MKKILLITSFTFFYILIAMSQESYAKWHKLIYPTGEHRDSDIRMNNIIEKDNYLYINGLYLGTDIKFDGLELPDQPSHFDMNGVLTKVDKNGNRQWTITISNSNNGSNAFYDIALDSKGDIIAVGNLFAIDSGQEGNWTNALVINGEIVLEPNGASERGLVAKFSGENGNLIWLVSWDGYANPRSVAIDGEDNIYTAGYYNEDFDIGNDYVTYALNNYGENAFIIKFDSEGKFIWSNSIDGQAYAYPAPTSFPRSLVVSGDYLYMAFRYIDPVTLDGEELAYENDEDGYWIGIAKMNLSDGKYDKYTVFGATEGLQDVNQIKADNKGNIILTGYFCSETDFKIGNTELKGYNDEKYYDEGYRIYVTDSYVAKFDADLNPVWAKQMGAKYNDAAFGVSIGENNSISVGGTFDSYTSLKYENVEILEAHPALTRAMFQLIISEDGEFSEAYALYGNEVGSLVSNSSSVMDNEGRLFSAGNLSGVVHFTESDIVDTTYESEDGTSISGYGFIMEWDKSGLYVKNHTTENKKQVDIYPNPFVETITVEPKNSEPLSLQLTDINGKNVYSGQFVSKTTLDFSWLAVGTYILKINTGKYHSTHKILKR